jgi:DNA gyrase subunit B
VSTTHSWAATVDAQHLKHIRERPEVTAPGGALHLVLEVLASALKVTRLIPPPHALASSAA